MVDNQQGDRPLDYGEINAELEALEGKNDPASNERRAGLFDDLITLDMAYGEYRRAMARAAKGSARRPDAEPQPEAATSDKSPTAGGNTIVGAANGPDDSGGQSPQAPTEPSIDKTGGGVAIIGIHAPESESAKRERKIAEFFLRNLEWMAGKVRDGGGDCYISFDVKDDQGGAESDRRPKRFVQFGFGPKDFFMDLPNTTLTASEAETILRDRPQFFFVNARRKIKDANASMAEFNPLQREYAYGEQRIAAEDIAFILFDVWRLPVNVALDVKSGRF